MAAPAGRALQELATLEALGLPPHEARVLLAEAFRTERGAPLSALELATSALEVPAGVAARAREWAQRRVAGELLQHLTGWQRFLDHDFEVGPAVLVPRPETEVLVTEALSALKKRSGALQGYELGLGSGVISVELLLASPELTMEASELSAEALALGLRNAERLGVGSRLRAWRASSGAEVMPRNRGPWDLVISNPPYLLGSAEATEEVALREPPEALYAPEGDPLYFYRELLHGCAFGLKKGGLFMAEVPHERESELRGLFRDPAIAQVFERPEFLPDLTGRTRVLRVTRKA